LRNQEYFDHPSFHRKHAATELFEEEIEMSRTRMIWNKILNDHLSQEDMMDVVPSKQFIFTPRQEKNAFLQYNYARYRVAKIVHLAHTRKPTVEQAKGMLSWSKVMMRIEDNIVVANLGLALAMMKRIYVNGRFSKGDGLQEANYAVLRATRKFDVSRGWKFSTYACNAVWRALGRWASKESKLAQKSPVSYDDTFDNRQIESDVEERLDLNFMRSKLRKCLDENHAQLSSQEERVIRLRFGFMNGEDAQPMTLEKVGIAIALTKERVRQIQERALHKISSSVGGNYAEFKRKNKRINLC